MSVPGLIFFFISFRDFFTPRRRVQLPVETRYTCAPRVAIQIKKILPWLYIGKNNKNLDILRLKRIKFEIFARVIDQIQENQ